MNPTRALRILEQENPPVVELRHPFTYERLDHPRLSELRRRYRLRSVVKDAGSEFEYTTEQIGARRPGDPPELVADSSRAQQLLGWQPRYTQIEEIVETAWRWHRAHPEGFAEAR